VGGRGVVHLTAVLAAKERVGGRASRGTTAPGSPLRSCGQGPGRSALATRGCPQCDETTSTGSLASGIMLGDDSRVSATTRPIGVGGRFR